MKSFYSRGMLAAATVMTCAGLAMAQDSTELSVKLSEGQDNQTVSSLEAVSIGWDAYVTPNMETEFQLMTISKDAVAFGKFRPLEVSGTYDTVIEFSDFQGDFTPTTPGTYQLYLPAGSVSGTINDVPVKNAGEFVFLTVEENGSSSEYDVKLVSAEPADGSVLPVFPSSISTKWTCDFEAIAGEMVRVYNEAGEEVAKSDLMWTFDYDIFTLSFTGVDMLPAGEYTVKFPEGALLNGNGEPCSAAATIHYTIGTVAPGYAYTFKSVNPEDGAQIESLRGLTTYWNGTTEETESGAPVVVRNEAGEEVSKGDLVFDWDDVSKYTVSFNPAVKEAGNYTVVIPEGALVNGGSGNEPVELHYTIGSGAEPVVTFDIQPTNVKPESGGKPIIEANGNEFRVNIEFSEPVEVREGFEFLLTDPEGVTYPLESKNMVMMGTSTLILNFPENVYVPENTYKLIIPAGTIGNKDWAESKYTNGHANPELIYEWTWVPVPQVVVIPDEVLKADLEIKSATIDGVDLLAEGAAIDAWKDGADLAISTNKDEWAHYLDLNFIDNKTGESIYTIATFENIGSDGKSQDNGQQDENGVFHFFKTRDLKFTEGHTYTIKVTAYQNLRVAEKVELGYTEISFAGATPAWVYSDVEIEDIDKDPDTYEFDNINDRSIVITYSAPVEIVTSADGVEMYTSISHGMEGLYDFESITPNEDKTVWTFTISEEELETTTGGLVINIVANDMNGLRVYPEYYDYNSGYEENAHQQYNYDCYLGCAVIECDPASESVVDSLYNFSFTCPTAAGQNIGFSGMGSKAAANGILYRLENGERAEEVARIDRNDYVEIDNGAASDVKVLQVDMHLDKVVEEEGEYELYLQPGFFMTGSEYDGMTNRNTSYYYTIKTTGVSEVLGEGVGVKVVEGGIAVSGTAEVYTISGVKVASVNGGATVALEKGIYMVVANGKAVKVAL